MSDSEQLLVANTRSVWHFPSDDDPDEPACHAANYGDPSYRRLRAEIARAWYDQCTLCAGDRSFGGQGDTALPTATEVPTDD